MWTPVVSDCLQQSKECEAANESSSVVDFQKVQLIEFCCNENSCHLQLQGLLTKFILSCTSFICNRVWAFYFLVGGGGCLLIKSLPRLYSVQSGLGRQGLSSAVGDGVSGRGPSWQLVFRLGYQATRQQRFRRPQSKTKVVL